MISKDKMEQAILKMRKKNINVRPYGRLRAIMKSILGFLVLHSTLKKYKKGLKIFKDLKLSTVYAINFALIKQWFIQKFPVFFKSIINYEDSFDFTVPNTDYIESNIVKKRFNKARPIIVYFFKRLIAVTNKEDMPQQLINFFNDFFSHGSSTEQKTLTDFEVDRLDIDEYNTIYNVSQEVKDFLRMYFFVGKGLIRITMLSADGFGVKLNSTSKKNLKVIASVIYHAMMDHLLIILPARHGYDKLGKENYEPISQMVFNRDDMAYFLKKQTKFYVDECQAKLKEWVKELDKL
jgi:hypothetical protein